MNITIKAEGQDTRTNDDLREIQKTLQDDFVIIQEGDDFPRTQSRVLKVVKVSSSTYRLDLWDEQTKSWLTPV